MSKTSIRSRISIRSLSREKKMKKEQNDNTQFGLCCAIGDYDPLSKYNQRKPPFKSSLTSITSIHECPVLKIKTNFIEHGSSISKKKGHKIKSGSATDRLKWITKKKSTSASGTLLKYLEDEVDFAIFKNTQRKQEAFKAEGEKCIALGKKKVKAKLIKYKKSPFPHWYQDYSNAQMKNLMVLKEALYADYEEKVIYRTQKILLAIGIISAFFKLTPNIITNLQRKSNLRPVDFLRETYKIKTGFDFEDEGYKDEYNCSERLILSGIAFLTLPETIIELNERLPPIKIPKYPLKPLLPQAVYPEKMDSPYKEKLPQPPDLRLYRIELYNWRKKLELIPKPKVILPPKEKTSRCYEYPTINEGTEEKIDPDFKKIGFHTNKEQSIRQNKNEKQLVNNKEEEEEEEEANREYENYNENSEFSKEQFDFTLSGLGDGSGHVQYKICGTLDPSQRHPKSWLGEKDLHYVISGIVNEDEPPQGRVSYELTGLAKVTPNNSNEDFFAKLKLGDGPNKIYPRGRQYLSKNWLEWLQNVDEEFLKAENEANKLIESVQATMRLVVPGPTCDSCCACRQTRKTNLNKHATKTPHMVIESIAEDANKKRYIVGSMSMQSPAPSLAESTVNLLEVVASHDIITKNLLINGITNDDGKTIYYISGVTKDIEHVPEEKIKKVIPKSVKNVPPCACAIEKIFNEGLDQKPSGDNIPVTKDGTCSGKKYRSKDGPAYSCKQYPNNKSCGINPFLKGLQENRQKSKMQKGDKDFYPPAERIMYSLPDFQPCGDEAGTAVCGGPWGATNIPSPEELARREEEAREIVKALPPPKPKPLKKEEPEDEGTEDEESKEEDTKVAEEPVETRIGKKRVFNRDKSYHVSPENLKEVSKSQDGILNGESDSNKCNDEIDCDTKRAAPSAKEVKNLYEKGLNKFTKEGSENKELIAIKNKADSKRPINSRIHPLQSLVETRRSKEDAESEVKKSWKGKVDQKIKNKRLVKSVKRPSTARKNEKINATKDNRKTEIQRETNFISGSKKLSTLRSPKTRKGSSKSYMKKTGNFARKSTNSTIRSKHEKLEQLKQEMQNCKDLPEMQVQPAVIPEEKSKFCKRDTKYEDGFCAMPGKMNQISKKEGPFGWRTESEQKLEPQKTLIYLTDPTYPIETVPVRTGGKACHCRENRNKKKILKYNIGGLINKVEEKRKKDQNVTQVIEGLTYVTPPPSPRRSDEYIPEYELYESPYDMCLRKNTDDALKLTERFLSPPSLMSKKPENNTLCGCGSEDTSNPIYLNDKKKQILEKEWTSENAPDAWSKALEDDGLTDFFAGCKDDVPCWLKCSQFSKPGVHNNIRKLLVKKPVCECKYERKIVQRNEAKQKWLERQERLKSYKKTPFTNIVGISRPMEPNKKFIISGVKKIPNEDGNDEVKYCVSGVAENYKMGPVQYLIDGVSMQTPLVTPKPSEKQIPCVLAHKHWSITKLPENMPSSDKEKVENLQGLEENQENVRPKRCDGVTKCKELASMNEVSNVKGNAEVVNEIIKNEKNKFLKTKSGRKDDENITRDSSVSRFENLNESEAQSLLKTQVQEQLKNRGASQIQTKYKLSKNYPEQSDSKVKVEKKKAKKYIDDGLDLMEIVTDELKKMATEGFIFAKLPKCYKMPQIQYWIMYRKGALFTDEDKKEILHHNLKSWKQLEVNPRKIQLPSMDLTELEIQNLDYEKAFELKLQIAAKKNLFYNQVRRDRVKKSAALWNRMEFGKFPSISFKTTYFTYLPEKEADGHLLEPPLPTKRH